MNLNQSSKTKYNTAIIRRLLAEAFSDEDFKIFCYDHFPPVYDKFGSGMTFAAKIQLLIEHCEQNNLFAEFLSLVKKANPHKFVEFASELEQKLSNSQRKVRNPFQFGGPVLPENFIGHHWAVDFCQAQLTAPQPVSIAINGERRIGKTSLLHYIQKFGPQEDWGQHICLFLDMGIFGGSSLTATTFWKQVLHLLRETLDATSPLLDQIIFFHNQTELPTQSFSQILKNFYRGYPNRSLTLLLDEFELIFRNYSPDIQGILTSLRTMALAPGDRITLITATRDPLPEVCRPFMQETGLEFHAHFVPCQLSFFDESEVRYVVQTLLNKVAFEFTEPEFNYIWQLSRQGGELGHPFLVQLAAYLIFEHKQRNHGPIDYLSLEKDFETHLSAYRAEIRHSRNQLIDQTQHQSGKSIAYDQGLDALERLLPVDDSDLILKFYQLKKQLRQHLQLKPPAEKDRNVIIHELTRLSLRVTGLSFEQLAVGQKPN